MKTARALIVVLLVAACSSDGTGPPAPPPPPPPPPPSPTQVSLVVQPSQTLRDSAVGPAITVEIRGASGTRFAGATNTVVIALGANPGSAPLSGTLSVAAVDGVATFSNLRVNTRERGYTLVATSTSLTPDTSDAFNIVIPMNPDGLTPGTGHSCALFGYGAYCWGRNDNGELGDSTLTLRTLPVQVYRTWRAGDAVSGLALGESHTCASTEVAELYCWGSDSSGQLGIGSQNDRRIVPTLVSGGFSFVFATAGRAHTCAQVAGTQDVYCWGANDLGQVGDSTNTLRTTPVHVAGGIDLNAPKAGRDHTCALSYSTGAAYCWGDNTFGQLGDSSTTSSHVPVPVAGGLTFNQIGARGNHTCGLTNTQEIYCWGENTDGQLGDSTTTSSNVPVKVKGGITTSGITAGGKFTCAMSSDVKLYCWGRNLDGQLGSGDFTGQLTPQLVGGNLYPMNIIAGERHTCAQTWDTGTYCWGSNTFGQLGDGTRATRTLPVHLVY